MVSRIVALLLSGVALLQVQVQAQSEPSTDLIGTWTSKSNGTITGDGFYDPKADHLIEPKHTGISYSFSADGHFEAAYYRAIANPQLPRCPKGIMQWQHGSYEKLANGSLHLKPIKVDGRQLYSDPCQYKNSVFTRYNATEKFKAYQVYTDTYNKRPRLDLFQADGAPIMPLYRIYDTPKMLPTTTLNPLTTASPTAASKLKRSLPHEVLFKRTEGNTRADQWWWFGVLMTAGGGVMYWFF
ncbi:cell wall biogenesis-related chaperone ROT1 [Parastagonospora nodorum]|uniref:Protein ROT1 n=1 Tax=Phaeosphaeria nodorum (strain SN15 / ATCC MYA-4574 / FGSC 10173) TaxID=321614 RepID=A0A7U2NQI0_PHANO|nr:cell wall biogenesis-related chaperone ROT1 [Parastagonospora nodorum]QRD06767.1 cell wall biogenesis-related chaperone ROT1 [Parastagonospora nodorum SN15]KAH3927324.1 cell wall biogenesis-related chaperone ROT1 [Parastagonospora nodorum]KAH3952288.1 cell wall biogenesis-related chaperone ROT1 [Parastagonospora nodorum]KAH3981884.1 cell wall biogenesis-related chaperone ROT1 [Parastagonospora nodorum]